MTALRRPGSFRGACTSRARAHTRRGWSFRGSGGRLATGGRALDAEWTTTSSILQGLRDYSDDRAWNRLAERFRAPIVAFARRMGVAGSESEDVAQETLLAFARAFREGRYERDKGRLGQWLFGFAHRQALAARRRAARHGDEGALDLAELPDDAGSAERWEEEWERALLALCLERARSEFPSATFQAFDLATRSDRSAAEVATKLGVNTKAVYNAKHRVLTRLRELREELEGTDP